MFVAVARRCLARRTTSISGLKLITNIRTNSNGPKIQFNDLKKREKQLNEQDNLSKEEKNLRKLKLQEELKKLQAEEDLEADEEAEINENERNVNKKSTETEVKSNQKDENNESEKAKESEDKLSLESDSSEAPTPEIISEIKQTITHDLKPNDDSVSAEIKHQDVTRIHHKPEPQKKRKDDDTSQNIDGLVNVLATSATLKGNKFPHIDDKINQEIHSEIDNLPSQKENRKSDFSKKITLRLESLQETILKATRALNDVTGYSAIEKLKKSIESLEDELKECKQNVKDAKKKYNESITLRSKSQREVNELLTRKHDWRSNDLERFTELYRNDHANELRENDAQKELTEAELKVDSVQLKLTQLILTRYHEEQIWSDKIRQASTWGTWILMGANLLLFIVATFFVEPWKRKRLVSAFEKQVKETLVGISQDDKEVIEPVMKEIEKSKNLEPMDPVIEEFKDFAMVMANIEEEQQEESIGQDLLENATNQSSNTVNQPLFPITIESIRSLWERIKTTLMNHYYVLANKQVNEIKLLKSEFTFFSLFLTIIGGGLGSVITVLVRR